MIVSMLKATEPPKIGSMRDLVKEESAARSMM